MYDGQSEVAVRGKGPLDELYAGDAVITAPIYSVGEGARYLRVAENTIRSWIDGRSYPVKKSGKARSNQIIVPAAASGSGARLSFLNLVEIHVLTRCGVSTGCSFLISVTRCSIFATTSVRRIRWLDATC
jgi:hypothetical protein